MAVILMLFTALLASFAAAWVLTPAFTRFCGKTIGSYIIRRTSSRRSLLLARVQTDREKSEDKKSSSISLDEEWERLDRSRSHSSQDLKEQAKDPEDWNGVIGFLHPFCNAGGGGERVLWAAIRAVQQKWPNALCVVYTGDHDVNKEQILARVKERFNIDLFPPTIDFLYLSTRHYVLNTTWPHFTLLGQSFGSLLMAWDAFNLLVPDIFVDTMGYAFTLALAKFLFPKIPTGAYVHYPTISTDMLESLDEKEGDTHHGVNAGAGTGWKGQAKRRYWHGFAWLYGWVGGSVDLVMTNSSWTQHHITQLWGKSREQRRQNIPIEVVFPPVAVKELERAIEVNMEAEELRQPILLYIAQFRPEKDHQLVLRAFAEYLHAPSSPATSGPETAAHQKTSLLLIGSVRTSADETYIYSLRLLAHELQITHLVKFVINASWPAILDHLRTASVGVNAMWNEHFGIGVVEYQGAGLISVVNDSGGPKCDIVVDLEDGPTGFRAMTEPGFAEAFGRALALSKEDKVAMRMRARRNAKRFDDEVFEGKWIVQMEKLVQLAGRVS